jgi:hypothetical protein
MDEEVADGTGSGVWDGELNQPSFTALNPSVSAAATAATAAATAATFRAMKPVKSVQASGCAM